MKNKIITIMVVITFIVIMILNFSLKNDSNVLQTIQLDNIEALATGEDDVRGMIECHGNGQLYCYLNNQSTYNEILIYQ